MTVDFVTLTGVLGLGINAFSLTRKSDHALRALIGLGFVVWALNNWLLAAHTQAVLCLVAASRQAVAVLVARHSNALQVRGAWFAFFMVIVAGSSLLTWNGWGTAYAALSSTLSTVAMFYLSGARLRLTVAAAYALWALTTYCAGSAWGVAANVMLTATALHAYYRLKRPDSPVAAPLVPEPHVASK